jgi:hypothetical protein
VVNFNNKSISHSLTNNASIELIIVMITSLRCIGGHRYLLAIRTNATEMGGNRRTGEHSQRPTVYV